MNDITVFLNNSYVIIILALLTASYGYLTIPPPSDRYKRVLTSDWFRFIVIFVIAYLPKRNFHLSFMIAIGFMITYHLLLYAKILEGFKNEKSQFLS